MSRLCLFAVVLTLLTLFPMGIVAQDTCPDSHICVEKDRARRFLDAGEEMRCLQRQLAEDDLNIEPEPYRIVVDDDGRVFADEEMTFRLKWCQFDLELTYEPEVDIHRKTETEPEMGLHFRPRIGVGFRFVPFEKPGYGDPSSLVEPLVLFESFYWRFLHFEAHLGLDSFGAGVGADLTENLDVYAGAGVGWPPHLNRVSPVLGLSVALW